MQVSVDWRELQCQLPNLKNCVTQINSLLPEIQSVTRGLSTNACLTAQIESQLRKASAQIKSCHDSLLQMQNAAEEIVSEYCLCEQRLAGIEHKEQEKVGSSWKRLRVSSALSV